ncbi:hypothetical protein F5Y17DRAFT_314808 [Xylariaceae sp. FL0594]|nr:hypothetical protein F5Y17DRAFT_314808 [Xylariaceae sp. FL0594]
MSSSGHDDGPSPGSLERLERNPVGSAAVAPQNQHNRRAKKKRVRNFTDDDRAAHRIFEKSRREAFKEALTNLASLLPALAETEPARLSKHVVVDESITLIKAQQAQIAEVTEQFEAAKAERDRLQAERDRLQAELEEWRGAVKIEPQEVVHMGQPVVHHSDTSASSDPILGGVPTVLRAANPPIPTINEAGPSFMASGANEANPGTLSADSNMADMSWESFDSRMQGFVPHPNHVPQQGQSEGRTDSDMGSPEVVQMPQFHAGHEQHNGLFMPFQQQQIFGPAGFPTGSFIQNPLPLQDFAPP